MNTGKQNQFRLKKPHLVYLLAVSFLFAPLANLAIPLFKGGHSSWYSPVIWFNLFSKLPTIEQILLIGIMAAGVLLFFQRKTSWFVAVVILILISGYGVFGIFENKAQINLGSFNLVVNASVLVVFYFFRFPYLDQRDHIIGGMAKRVHIQVEAKINEKLSCTMKNISDSGCFLELLNNSQTFQIGQTITIQVTNPKINANFSGTVEHMGNGLGIKFVQLNQSQKNEIEKLKNS